MPRFMADTNCVVALLLPQHEHHDRAAGEIERRLDEGQVMALAGHSLIETYAVLTRLPAPHRLSPSDCRTLLEANFGPESVEIVALTVEGYLNLIHEAPDSNVSGGRVYDAVISACARSSGVDALLTFNERHFAQFSGEDLAIVVPP